MQSFHVPTLSPRYWVALVAASALGTNTGDLAAHHLHLGHAGGLLPLAGLFAVILWSEARSRSVTAAFYWLAIVTLRTAATNLADFADHDLRLAPLLVLAALTLALAGLVLTDPAAFTRPVSAAAGSPTRPGVPDTDGRYWLTMLVAGVLGTALGDYLADDCGLDPGLAALITVPATAALLALRRAAGWRSKAGYWLVVAAVRTAGTNIGDGLAAREGLGLGLPISTALTAITFVGILTLWRSAPAAAPRAAGARAP